VNFQVNFVCHEVRLLAPPVRAEQKIDRNRFALLIGNSAYRGTIKSLKSPQNDVKLIKSALLRLNFAEANITVVPDASVDLMLTEIGAFAAKVKNGGPDAVSFFYYSGHGAADESQDNYLIPVDLSAFSTVTSWPKSLRLDDVVRVLSNIAPNASHFVIFDACRNTLLFESPVGKDPTKPSGFAQLKKIPMSNMVIAFATAEGERASDDSKYASALAEEIMTPGLPVYTVLVNLQVRMWRQNGQSPWMTPQPSKMEPIYLAGYAMTPTTLAQQQELEFFRYVNESNNSKILNTYLLKYPTGHFSEAVRTTIEEVEKKEAEKKTKISCADTEKQEEAARELEKRIERRKEKYCAEKGGTDCGGW
jgi:Caspase domain